MNKEENLKKHPGDIENDEIINEVQRELGRKFVGRQENEKRNIAIKFIGELIDQLYFLKRFYSQLTDEEKIENRRREEDLGKLYNTLKVDKLWKIHMNGK